MTYETLLSTSAFKSNLRRCTKDRWGQTPLQDAVNNHHGRAVQV